MASAASEEDTEMINNTLEPPVCLYRKALGHGVVPNAERPEARSKLRSVHWEGGRAKGMVKYLRGKLCMEELTRRSMDAGSLQTDSLNRLGKERPSPSLHCIAGLSMTRLPGSKVPKPEYLYSY
eukprot:gb/GECG01015932.1/.p1 GENE.gb/GECG01015932.1/~~gb/GECG01015932.1/.p1  ORF type:complete len:124 (+),score=14.03 gb/GECG01015932.1/:1-372(+)